MGVSSAAATAGTSTTTAPPSSGPLRLTNTASVLVTRAVVVVVRVASTTPPTAALSANGRQRSGRVSPKSHASGHRLASPSNPRSMEQLALTSFLASVSYAPQPRLPPTLRGARRTLSESGDTSATFDFATQTGSSRTAKPGGRRHLTRRRWPMWRYLTAIRVATAAPRGRSSLTTLSR